MTTPVELLVAAGDGGAASRRRDVRLSEGAARSNSPLRSAATRHGEGDATSIAPVGERNANGEPAGRNAASPIRGSRGLRFSGGVRTNVRVGMGGIFTRAHQGTNLPDEGLTSTAVAAAAVGAGVNEEGLSSPGKACRRTGDGTAVSSNTTLPFAIASGDRLRVAAITHRFFRSVFCVASRIERKDWAKAWQSTLVVFASPRAS